MTIRVHEIDGSEDKILGAKSNNLILTASNHMVERTDNPRMSFAIHL